MDRLILGGVLAVAGWLYGHYEYKQGYKQAELVQQAASAVALDAVVNESQRRLDAAQAETLAARNENAKIIADYDALRVTADGLRGQVRKLASDAKRRDSAAPIGSDGVVGGDAIGVLAELFDRHTRELEAVGKYADELRVAGLACEGVYNSLTPIGR